MVTTKLNLSMTEPQVRQIYAKQGDTGRVLDISLDQTPEDGTLRILRPDGVEVTSEAVTGGEVSESGETVTFDSLTEADVTELTVGIEPVQDLNGYDAPWVGGAGTNKYDDSAKTNAFINEQGAGSTINSWYLSDYCAIPLGTTKVTLSWQSEMAYYQGRVVAYDSSKTFISGSFVSWAGTAQSHTFDVPSTASYVRVNYSHVVNSQESPRNNVRLNVGTSDLGYSPYSNICPITGHDEVTVADEGKNRLDNTVKSGQTLTSNGVSCTINSDGSVTVSGTATSWTINAWFVGNYGIVHKVKRFVAGTYTFTDFLPFYHYVDETNLRNVAVTFASRSATFTFTKDWWLDGVRCPAAEKGTEYNLTLYPQIELGATATSFEPYRSNTYTTSLGQTVYGGTLDLVSGVLTVDSRYLTVDDFSDFNGGVSGGGLHWVNVPQTYPAGVNDDTSTNVCSHAPYSSNNGTGWSSRTPMYNVNSGGGFPARIYVASASLADFKTEYAALQAVYKLAEPVTYQLTPKQIKTLVGTNNVWASSRDIVNITFTYGGLLSELPSEATEIVGKCYCDVEQNGVSSMPFTLNVKKNERES